MGIHQREVHPEYVEGCWACKASSVSVAPSATPSRGGGQEAARINATEKEWAKDMRAYKSIRSQGLQPRSIDGAARLEGATDRIEVEAGHLFKTSEERKQVRAHIETANEFKAQLEGRA